MNMLSARAGIETQACDERGFRQVATTIGRTGQQECKVCDTAIGDFWHDDEPKVHRQSPGLSVST